MKALFLIIVVAALGGAFYYFAQDVDTGTPIVDETVDQETETSNDATNDATGTRPNDELLQEQGEDVPENDSVGGDTDAGAPDAAATDESESSDTKEFTIDSFSFGYDMEEIRVAEGDTVTINLTNSDGFHDWVVDEFDAATEQIREGETTSVTFVADAAGTYEYYCSVGNHREQGMVGTLIVE